MAAIDQHRVDGHFYYLGPELPRAHACSNGGMAAT